MSGRIFISACYIVKDEADVLERSLLAVAPFVDEVVVYDTGSSDDTVAIARACGATVVQGFWDDDFGAARNRALEHCSGDWVLNIDADEVAEGDPRDFRRRLTRNPTADTFSVSQMSSAFEGTTASLTLEVSRVLRRSACRWSGALHEQIVGVRGQALKNADSGLKLLHSGYTLIRSQDKDKGERNYRVAQQELARAVAAGDPDTGGLLINLGRSAHQTGRRREALEVYEGLDSSASFHARVMGAHAAVEVATELGEFDVAERWVQRLEQLGEDARVVRWSRAQLLAKQEKWGQVIELVDSLSDTIDLRGVRFAASLADPTLAVALFNEGQYDRAADVVLRYLRTGTASLRVPIMLHIFAGSGRDVGELVDALSDSVLVPVLGQLTGMPYQVAGAFLEAMWSRGRAAEAVLLTAGSMWSTLTVNEALVWSLRMRERGVAQYCPLRSRFTAPEADLRLRIVCGAALAEAGEDVWAPLGDLLAEVTDEDAAQVVAEVAEVSPRIAASLQPA